MAKSEFSKLEETYLGFINPDFTIKVGQKTVQKDFAIVDLKVKMSAAYDIGSCEFTVAGIMDLEEGEIQKEVLSTFKTGEVVEVEVGYTSNLQGVFKGYINSLAYEFSGQGPAITVECLDAKGALVNNKTWVNFGKKDIKEIVTSILNEKCKDYADIGTIESDFDAGEEGAYDESPEIKKDVDDYQYLKAFAERTNNSFCVIYDKIHFCKNLADTAEVGIKLEWGKHLLTFSMEHDISQQIGAVEVYGMDHIEHKTFSGKATNTDQVPKVVKNKVIMINDPKGVVNEGQATALAKHTLAAHQTRFMTCKGSTIGLPDLKAGDKVEIGGMGEGLNGTYYLTHVTHSINGGGYLTSFEGSRPV